MKSHPYPEDSGLRRLDANRKGNDPGGRGRRDSSVFSPDITGRNNGRAINGENEIAFLLSQLAVRYPAPPRLHRYYANLAREEASLKKRMRRRIMLATFCGAMAGGLAITAVWHGTGSTPQTNDPISLIAEEARAIYHRTMLQVDPPTQNIPQDRLLAALNDQFRHQPKVTFRDNKEFHFVGGDIVDLSGQRVPTFRFRSGNRSLLLVVLTMKDNVPLARIPENDLEIYAKGSSPPASIWRHGSSVYALVGYTSPETMKKFSSVIVPAVIGPQP